MTDVVLYSLTGLTWCRNANLLYTLDGAVGVGYKAKPDFYASKEYYIKPSA
jgi:hypothetical protein